MLLQEMTRSLAIAVVIVLAATASAQVQVDKPIVLTGVPPGYRRVENLAPVNAIDNLAQLGAARNGSLLFCTTSGTANAISLVAQPPQTAYGNGLLVRWIPTTDNTAGATLELDGLGAVPLRDRSGLAIAASALRTGVPVEAQFADSVFILMAPARSGCPEGFIPANDNLCIMQNEGPSLSWFAAAEYCFDRGARLCTWDQYLFTCNALQGQLTGMFNNWEWIEDTSDHTHSADQSGRWTCISMFNISASQTDLAITRCCYEPR